MGWWLLRLSTKILALLRLSVIFFQLRFCFKELNINKPLFLYVKSKIKILESSRDEFREDVRAFFPRGQSKLSLITSCFFYDNEGRYRTTVCRCLVTGPHYSARPMRFGSRCPSKFCLGYATEML